MKRFVKLLALTMMIMMTFSMTALAAGWTAGQGADSSRWWYDLGNGTWYAGTENTPNWQWLDGNQDGIAECYAFDAEGWMYAGGTTPDGYEVNGDGAWTVNGAVQTRQAEAQNETEPAGDGDILIAYFSRTGTTEESRSRPAEPFLRFSLPKAILPVTQLPLNVHSVKSAQAHFRPWLPM